jgi:hypothetical protein
MIPLAMTVDLRVARVMQVLSAACGIVLCHRGAIAKLCDGSLAMTKGARFICASAGAVNMDAIMISVKILAICSLPSCFHPGVSLEGLLSHPVGLVEVFNLIDKCEPGQIPAVLRLNPY